ncbi:ATP-dependent Clp protease proteolytic subunit [Ruegeria atlantica]|uniref:ATP-dependent Clp protease proteolytic subunit n=1 Tax=Ruegeria atlantica TaxID=81569 RepID=UPI0024959735|nr:ATP-dependent Clp protease proteolytic subunit [Ruegeria atlantica]
MVHKFWKGALALSVSGLVSVATSAFAMTQEFHGEIAGWSFVSRHYNEESGDPYTGVICSMTAETSDGDTAGLQWGATDDGEPQLRFWHSFGDETHTEHLLFDDGEGQIPVIHYSDDEFHYFYVVASDFGTARSAREFYSLIAGSNKISTSGHYLTLPGTSAALKSEYFNECMGYNFFEAELSAFGLDHIPSYEDRPGYASKTPQPEETNQPDFIVTYVEGKDEIWFSGDLNRDSMREVVSLIVKHEPTRLVIENSPGGLVYDATIAAGILNRYQIDTHVEGACLSACVILYAGGHERTAAADARFGIHQMSGGTIASTQESFSRIDDLFLTAGVDSRLLFEMMRIEADDMKYLNVLEASAYGLVN